MNEIKLKKILINEGDVENRTPHQVRGRLQMTQMDKIKYDKIRINNLRKS